LFGFIIAVVGCYEGLRVSASAESVGRQTTRSVVESIALVIAIDTVFVVFFSIIGV
jgi:phospholipid/cholesterol/gamma-HCH transport system permease protein